MVRLIRDPCVATDNPKSRERAFEGPSLCHMLIPCVEEEGCWLTALTSLPWGKGNTVTRRQASGPKQAKMADSHYIAVQNPLKSAVDYTL